MRDVGRRAAARPRGSRAPPGPSGRRRSRPPRNRRRRRRAAAARCPRRPPAGRPSSSRPPKARRRARAGRRARGTLAAARRPRRAPRAAGCAGPSSTGAVPAGGPACQPLRRHRRRPGDGRGTAAAAASRRPAGGARPASVGDSRRDRCRRRRTRPQQASTADPPSVRRRLPDPRTLGTGRVWSRKRSCQPPMSSTGAQLSARGRSWTGPTRGRSVGPRPVARTGHGGQQRARLGQPGGERPSSPRRWPGRADADPPALLVGDVSDLDQKSLTRVNAPVPQGARRAAADQDDRGDQLRRWSAGSAHWVKPR